MVSYFYGRVDHMQKLLGYVRCALDKYKMIEEGDRIAVAVSGGKDSVALLAALGMIRRFYPVHFTLTAITIDPCFGGTETDYSPIENLCKDMEIPYIIKRTELGTIIFETRKEKNPCSLCARMRRGLLHDTAKETGCNKIALGHHLDDAAETFMMNLFSGGRISCFSPVSYLSRKDLYMIRPLVLARESIITSAAERNNLPVVKSRCPADGVTHRQKMKDFLVSMEKDYPGIQEKIVSAMTFADIDRWGETNSST